MAISNKEYIDRVESLSLGPVCFRFSQTRLDYNLSEDFLASRFSLLVVQISEAAYHISENRWK